MKIEMTSDCFVEGKAVKVGDVVDTSQHQLLIGMGKAIKHVEKPKPEPKVENKPKKGVKKDD